MLVMRFLKTGLLAFFFCAPAFAENDPATHAEIKGLASSIYADMAKSNNGDAAKMQGQLQKALADPKAFMNGLSPEQQSRIRQLASEIDKKNAAKK